jgi:tetratricopeptide (TPR) repeat protein
MRPNPSPRPLPDTWPPGLDPTFVLAANRSVHLSKSLTRAEAGDYLAHWLARHPQDLTRHVQRIQLHIDLNEPDRLFAALIDLAIALGNHGEALRKRMLAMATKRLDPAQRQLLSLVLPLGLAADHHLGDIPSSVLGQPVGGDLSLVERAERVAVTRSCLEEARALVDDGHLDAAQSLLERALLEAPQHAELAEELLVVYRATRNAEGYARYRRLLERNHALPASWQSVPELSGGQDGQ